MWLTALKTMLTHKYAIGLVLLILSLGGTYIFIKTQESKIDRLQQEVEALETVIQAREIEIKGLQLTADRLEMVLLNNKVLIEKMEDFSRNINLNIKKELEVFKDHNLENLAAKKPGLIESRVNSATLKVFEQIEEETVHFDTEWKD